MAPAADLRAIDEHGASSAVALEWLEQVIATVPIQRHDDVLRTIHRLVGELRAVLDAATAVRARGDEAALASLFETGAPLHRHLVDLHAWAEALCGALEEIAVGLRRGEPVRSIFLQRAIDASYARLDAHAAAIRAQIDRAARRHPAAAQALDADLEELAWATSWLHVSLTKRFGE